MLDCPAALDKLITQLLQKNPEQRPASAAEVKQRLEAVLRPSLSHVDPMALTPADPIPRAVTSTTTDSDHDLATIKTAPKLSWPWPTAVVALSLLTIWGWWSAAAARGRIHELERMWVAAALQPGPGQLPAMQQLAQDRHLSPQALDEMARYVESSNNEDGRVAALVVIEQHARQATKYHARLLSLQKSEQTQKVREQIDRTLATIKSTDASPGTTRSGWLWFILFGLIGVGIAGWCWIAEPWKRWMNS
jgi:hypothetical protein